MKGRIRCWVLAGIAILLASCGDFVIYDQFSEPLAILPASISLYSYESADFSAEGGAKGYRFAVLSGAGAVNSSTGVYTAPSVAGTDVVEVADAKGNSSRATIPVLGPKPIVISPAATSLVTGTACQFTASGGKPGYSFTVPVGNGSIDPSTGLFTAPLASETDTVLVVDADGNSATATVTVVEPLALLVMPAQATLMTGSSLQFGAVGGTPPYSFSRPSGSGSVTAAGLYSAPATSGSAMIRVTDSLAATSDAAVTVVSSGPLGLNATATSVEEGKTAGFSAYGGSPPYYYSLSPGSASGGSITALSGAYTAGPNVGNMIDTVIATDSTAMTVSLNVTVVPAAPSGSFADAAYGGPEDIGLSWYDTSSSEDGFNIYRKPMAGVYSLVGTVAADVVFWADTGLTPNQIYVYRIKAFKGALESNPSEEAWNQPN
jgi:hypothetical protein